jgi:putative salt-induced outer membrane protein YdiY
MILISYFSRVKQLSSKKILAKNAILIFIYFYCAAGILNFAEEEHKENKTQLFYSSSTSFSFLLTSGNTEELSLGFDTEQNVKFRKSDIEFKGSVIFTRSDGDEQSEIYYSHIKYNYNLDSKVYLLGLGRFERNVSSGYRYRLAFSAGGGYNWISRKKLNFASEMAFGWSNEDNIEKLTKNDIKVPINHTTELTLSSSFASYLFSNKIEFTISSSAKVMQQFLYFLNLDNRQDFRLSTYNSLSVSINNYVALKMSYQLNYSHHPIPGFKNIDFYLLSSLVLKW